MAESFGGYTGEAVEAMKQHNQSMKQVLYEIDKEDEDKKLKR